MNYQDTLYQKNHKNIPRILSTQDIPYRKGKVGARKTFPQK